ncbi:MAG: OmpA family protein [Gallionella sp.]|nr:OmpA family protein [Gallionella sp.]
MKKNTLVVALAAALLTMSAAQASEFAGGYLGLKAGQNRSDVSAVPSFAGKNATTFGLEGGYNWDINSFLLGVSAFADFNQKATHATSVPATFANYGTDVYGLDAKLGLPSGNWLPYAKLGYGSARGTGLSLAGSGSGAHLGLGVEYKFASHWSVAGEFTNISAKNNGIKVNNNNLTIGLNYYFNEPSVAPAAVAAVAAAAVVAPAPTPAPEAAPAVSDTWKTLLEEKPVTLKGTNFDFDSAKLRPAADAKLTEVAEFAATYKDAKLDVSGHTDSVGSDTYNQKLSERRANSVKAYLVKKGVAADRIVTEGYGETKPVADNKTKEGRAENRRVEIRSVIKEETKVRVNP